MTTAIWTASVASWLSINATGTYPSPVWGISICNITPFAIYGAPTVHYTRDDMHFSPQYDALAVLQLFSPDDVEWNAHVDFAGGEPTLLDNLEEYLEFFRTRRIRVLMFTNAVRFHQAIYDGLADGSIYWVITSLDAGTPSTFKALRGRDGYLQVLENLSRYAVAGSKGKGMLAAKYIFCESNCGDDDIAGFAYAMLALRPQKVWLTFDFSPRCFCINRITTTRHKSRLMQNYICFSRSTELKPSTITKRP